MATTTTTTNKPLNPRAQDLSPKGYNRANIFSGKALDFDGVNDYVDCGTLDVTAYTAISISFNLKLANVSDTDRILSLKHTGIDDIRFLQVSNELLYTLDDGTAYSLTSPELVANEWFKIDMTFNGTTLKGYLNGVEFGSMAASFDFSTADGLLYLFRHTEAAAYAEGEMAGFKIFNTALTPAQVSDLYLNPEKIVPDGVASSALKLWLPMMEGAGASAYDGSGNGNHGTINGATWTAGIGAPVAQTALVSWNKGTNLLPYSEEFNLWAQSDSSVTADDTTAPNGTTTADKWVINNSAVTADVRQTITSQVGKDYLLFVFAKADEFSLFQLDTSNSQFGVTNVDFNLSTGSIVSSGDDNVTEGIIDKGNGWYLCYMVGTAINTSGSFIIRNDATQTGDGSKGLYLWGGGYVQASDITPYIPTIGATAQTSPVLLPQGLTANKDITGVNAFESARNAFALNLDGASWGRVGRNTSVSPTTAITLEAWIKKSAKSGFHHILSRNSTTDYYYSMFTEDATGELCFQGTTSATYKTSGVDVCTGSWVHVLVAYNTTQALFYVNGVLVSTNALTDALTPNSVDLFIGARPSGIQLYDAQLANPRIYNRALTAAEVLRNYNADRPKFGL